MGSLASTPAAAGAGDRRQILCVMRIPPDIDGVGGSQRAWRLLGALRTHGDVHFVLVYRDGDHDCMTTPLAPIEPLCRSVTRIEIAAWRGARGRKWGFVPGRVQDLVGMRSHEAPRLPARELAAIARQLPIRDPDVLFAGRLPVAVVMQSLIDRGDLGCAVRVVDFDDVMSKARRSQVASAGATLAGWRRAMTLLDAHIIEGAERRIAATWDAVSVCTDEDAAALAARIPRGRFAKVPNVVDRPWLPPRPRDGTLRMLFVGNLSFPPNVDGLTAFVERAWPALSNALPGATLTIVGINPAARVAEMARAHGFALHADVPRLQPYYEACDVVLAPILSAAARESRSSRRWRTAVPWSRPPWVPRGWGSSRDATWSSAKTSRASRPPSSSWPRARSGSIRSPSKRAPFSSAITPRRPSTPRSALCSSRSRRPRRCTLRRRPRADALGSGRASRRRPGVRKRRPPRAGEPPGEHRQQHELWRRRRPRRRRAGGRTKGRPRRARRASIIGSIA